VARQPTLVQLSDDLLAVIDEQAARAGTSRSELIRQAVEAFLAEQLSAGVDTAIVAGYKRVPPPEGDAAADAAFARLVEEEPW
jgi:metal-responsive CopG/Arc/MetJ family transcriptional regulator